MPILSVPAGCNRKHFFGIYFTRIKRRVGVFEPGSITTIGRSLRRTFISFFLYSAKTGVDSTLH